MNPGERLYLQDAKLVLFRAAVTDVREYARKDGVSVWQVALDRTAFYPTGGGQPHDTGTLLARSRGGAELVLPVSAVEEDEAGEVWHTTGKPLPAGTEVEGAINAGRRGDHARQHTGQHLLSAVLADRYGAPTVGFHLGEKDATVDLLTEARDALPERLPEVERQVNEHILQNLPVGVRTVSREEAEKLLEEGRLRKLPPREGPIRVVSIEGLDENACGGTHVGRLGEIGPVLLRETERLKSGLRLHFVCGGRAVRAARADWVELGAAAAMLSVGAGGVAEAVLRLQAETRALAKERLRLREEIAEDYAVQLAVEVRIEHGLRLVCRVFRNRDVEFVKLLAAKLLLAVPHTAAVLVSTSGEVPTVVVASNVAAGTPCDALLREVLLPFKLRGGGTAELAQAQVPEELLEGVTEMLRRRLSGG